MVSAPRSYERSTTLRTRKLGKDGLTVSALGLGCMGMSDFYGPSDESESLATLERALELGVSFWDTSDAYGVGANERLIAKILRTRREEVTLATKFGFKRTPEGALLGIDGSPGWVRRACDASLERLGVERIDLYYQHRVDPQVAIEETVGAMAELVRAGKVRWLGLSEASAETLRRASAVHPIAALQTEYSLWTRDVESEILPTTRELGISLVAYSPLGRGFLAGRFRAVDDLAAGDWRRDNPRFEEENLQKNLALADRVRELAKTKGMTPAQLALAWLLSAGEDIIPIPGTRSPKRLEENAAAANIALTPEERAALSAELPPAAGTRYPAGGMARVNL
jgi:aryl-alcohol dehydrogenase-like predicted oxidoreductase